MLTASMIFIIIGAVCVIAGRLWDYRIESGEFYLGRSEGVVTEIVPGEPDGEGLQAGIHDYYYPVICYYANGRLYRERYFQGSNPCPYRINDRLELCYDDREPTHFRIREKGRNRIISRTVYYLGFLFCCMGGIFFLMFATRG